MWEELHILEPAESFPLLLFEALAPTKEQYIAFLTDN